jgi:hypothetical protein
VRADRPAHGATYAELGGVLERIDFVRVEHFYPPLEELNDDI